MPNIKATITKVSDRQHAGLRGKLLEIRKIGSKPIFIAVTRKDSIATALKNADIPTDDEELKLEGIRNKGRTWESISLKDHAYDFSKIAVTTKVAGAR
jgi:hypothetical protein